MSTSRKFNSAVVTSTAVVVFLGLIISDLGAASERRQPSGTLRLMATPVTASAGLTTPLLVTLRLETVTQESVVIPSMLLVGGNVSIELLGPSGNRMPYRGKKYKLMPFKRGQFLSLAPTYLYGRVVNLRDFFSVEMPGRYRVRVSFSNADDGQRHGLNAWTGEVVADEISIDLQP